MTEQHVVVGTGKERDAVKIVTSYLATPNAVRNLDWMAYAENWRVGDPIGHGATEQEAIDDLREELESRFHPAITGKANGED